VLGALAIIPAIAALPALASATVPGIDPTRFNRRLANYRRLKDGQEAFYAANVVPLDEAHDRTLRDTPEWRASLEAVLAAEREHDRHVDHMSQACNLMLLTPAPTLAALATKLETMVSDGQFDCGQIEGVGIVLLADVRRLGGEA